MVNWLRFWSRAYVMHLEEEIAWLRDRLDMERHRAEVAIDNLINVRVAATTQAPVQAMQQPVKPEQSAEAMDALVRRLQADPEFANAGNAE